jgi:GDPmannose 4,6-dehydratase
MDGSHLADLLLGRGHDVHGMHRHSSVDNLGRIAHVRSCVTLHRGDLLDLTSIRRILQDVQPDELFNVADQDNVEWSHAQVGLSMDVTAGAVGKLLEIVRQTCPKARVFQPLSVTMFGMMPPPQGKTTAFDPLSPYACAKVASFYLCRMYRRVHGLHVVTGVMANHDSPRRSDGYLLQKIARGAVGCAWGRQKELRLGALAARVDVGCAREFMECVIKAMEYDEADDWIIGSGKAHTIQEIAKAAFVKVGRDWRHFVREDATLLRPGPMPHYCTDISDTQKRLGWRPQKDSLDVVRELVSHFERQVNLEHGQAWRDHG